MYHAMKQALRARRGHGVHSLMEHEDREALGLAPEAGHATEDVAMEPKAEMAHDLLAMAHSKDAEGPAEEADEDMAMHLLEQAHEPKQETMPHSGKIQDEHHMAARHKPKSIREAAMMHEKHLSKK